MKAILTILIVLFSTSALAEFSYDFIEAAYIEVEFDDDPGPDTELDGWGVEISKDLGEGIFIAGSYSDLDIEIAGVDLGDLQDYALEIGGHSSITEQLDVVLSVALGQEDIEGIKTEYVAARFGLRYWIVDGLVEAGANAGYLNAFESDVALGNDDSALYSVELRLQPIPEASIGVSYGESAEFDDETLAVDLRYQF